MSLSPVQIAPSQARMVMVGRELLVREVVFDALAPVPSLAGIPLGSVGPVGAERAAGLAAEASAKVQDLGYPPDAFALLGIEAVGIVAVLPETANDGQAERLLEALGLRDRLA